MIDDVFTYVALQCDVSSTSDLHVRDEVSSINSATTTCHQVQYFQPSSVCTEFLYLIDQISNLIQSFDFAMLLGICKELKASHKRGISLFSDDQIKLHIEHFHKHISLSLFCTWSDHSILRQMIAVNCDATELLDNFVLRLDPFQPISIYPIPSLSPNMLPTDASTHTILAIRCEQEVYKCTLQYVYDIRSLMMGTCEITQHCLQLLAIRSDPTILYWAIPKCVVDLITEMVPQHSELLYSRGILEVIIYPNVSLATGDDVKIGSIAFLDDNHYSYEEVSSWILFHLYMLTFKLACNFY